MHFNRHIASDMLLALLLCCAVASAAGPDSNPANPIRLTDGTRKAGLDFHLVCGDDQKKYLMETMCGGAAFFDYDNDGWLDILLVNGSTLALTRQGKHPLSKLYRNDHDGTFTDVTEQSGLVIPGWGMGAAVADYDNDGWVDVYVTLLSGAVLFHNQGDGTLRNVTAEAGVDNAGRWGASAAFGDYDNDGWLDLYVANYVHLDPNQLPEPVAKDGSLRCQYRGVAVACGPMGLEGERDRLYHNNGDGTFTDVTETLGLDPHSYYGLGVAWADYNNDGWADLYVANDSNPSLLYRNNGDGTFMDVGLLSGAAVSADGRLQAGMGVDVGDYDNDGRLDLVKTNFSDDTNNLYWNTGNEFFEDRSGASGFGPVSRPLLGFGIRMVDLNNDGWLDIYVTNGHLTPHVDIQQHGITYAQRDLLFRNLKGSEFDEVGLEAGLRRMAVGRGVASGDFDNDGDVDLLVTQLDDSPLLLRNDSPGGAHWLQIRTVGTQSNRDGIGARITVETSSATLVGEVRANSSYLTSSDTRVHFGLDGATTIKRITVRWPSGVIDAIDNQKADQELVVTEGRGVSRQTPQAPSGGPTPRPDP